MTRDDIATRVIKIVTDQLAKYPSDVQKSAITLDADLAEDLDFDSLDHIELIMSCEEEFDVEVPDEEMEEAKTVAQVVDLLAKKQQVAA